MNKFDVIVEGKPNGDGYILRYRTKSGTDIFCLGVPLYYSQGGDWDLGPTWCYVVPGDGITLIDTGQFGKFDVLESMLGQAGFLVKDIKRIIVTHSHEDHDGNIPEVVEASGAEVWAHCDYTRMIAYHPDIDDGARHPDFPAFSLFYWALETPVAAVDMSVVDAVLKEVDQTLEESKVEVKQEEKVEVSTIAIKPEEIKKEPAQPVTPPVLVETKTEDIPTLIMGISTGGMIPFGGNLKDYYDMGLPLSIQIKKPEVAKLGKFSLNLGIETGYYWVKDPTGVKKDLRGAPFYFVGDVDFSSILPGKLCLNAELATGLHMQISDGLFSGTYFGYSPRVSLGYMLGKNTKFFAKVGGTQIFSNKDLGGSAANGGSQEWIDFRLGIDYIFHRTLPDYSVSPDAGLIPSFKLGVFGGPMYPWGGNIDYIYEIGMPVHVQVMFPQVATLKNANVDMGVEFGYYKIAAKLAGRNDLYGVPIYLVGGLDFSSKLPEKLTMGAELAVGLNLQSDEKITNGAFVYASTSPRFTFGYRITDSLELSAKIGGSWIISNFDMGWTTGKSMQDPQEWLDFKLGLSYYFK